MSFESHYTPYSKCISLPPLKSVLALVPYNLSPASCSIVSPTDIKLPLPIEFGKLSSKPQIVPVQSSKPLYNTNQSIPDLSKTTVAHYCRLKQQSSPPINIRDKNTGFILYSRRRRRNYHEIERFYTCNFPGCTKAYGTLNHLNDHINLQKHGNKRRSDEFSLHPTKVRS